MDFEGGDVTDRETLIKRFMDKVQPEPMSGCWLWVGSYNNRGYGILSINNSTKKAHRVSWDLFRTGSIHGFFVCHKCDVRGCVNPDHLFSGTAKDNKMDQMAKGRFTPFLGDGHASSKMTEELVIKVRKMARIGFTHSELAALYGVHKGTISKAITGETWGHLKEMRDE